MMQLDLDLALPVARVFFITVVAAWISSYRSRRVLLLLARLRP